MLISSAPFVSTAEAAYIAGVTDREVNLVLDQHVLPASLLQAGDARRIARLAAAFISFYVKAETLFAAPFRRRALIAITERLRDSGQWQAALALRLPLDGAAKSSLFALPLDVSQFVRAAQQRAACMDDALRHFSSDMAVMGGAAVFRGTRVPADTILASLDGGVGYAWLLSSYPFLTPELVQAARIYAAVRPSHGRPLPLSELRPDWKIRYSKVIRAASV